MDALRAGKAVFVEKPLATSVPDLLAVRRVIEETGNDRLFVGFNRRFSPLVVSCRDAIATVKAPVVGVYRVNAGPVPEDSWVGDPVEGGGRIVGEMCHFVDTLAFLAGSDPLGVTAARAGQSTLRQTEGEGLTATVRFHDGSLGTIHYVANGAASLSKERVEAFSGSRAFILENYRKLTVFERNRRRTKRALGQAKGHQEEVRAFVSAVKDGTAMPLSPDAAIRVTATTFAIERSLERGGEVLVSEILAG